MVEFHWPFFFCQRMPNVQMITGSILKVNTFLISWIGESWFAVCISFKKKMNPGSCFLQRKLGCQATSPNYLFTFIDYGQEKSFISKHNAIRLKQWDASLRWSFIKREIKRHSRLKTLNIQSISMTLDVIQGFWHGKIGKIKLQASWSSFYNGKQLLVWANQTWHPTQYTDKSNLWLEAPDGNHPPSFTIFKHKATT